MKRSIWLFALLALVLTIVLVAPTFADSSHARIVRLSLVQGEVRFSQGFHNDSLGDANAVWEVAPLNLPIRQGYALATDSNGRAEVEFENGAMAFLAPNTDLEFYDLSLDEGAHITRLILRQGSAIFYVHPASDDFFSVTGGDYSVIADGRTRFRLDNFDDGSTVSVDQGRVSVLHNKETKSLDAGQSLSVRVANPNDLIIGRIADSDDFDKWVSGRIEGVATATTYASQYMNSPGYTAGLADLYNYGSWMDMGAYGFGWQPFGVGFGWNPFSFGNWAFDPLLGWNFIGAAPWGWMPFHYGGWLFSPIYGWVWMPSGFGFGGFGTPYYSPVTAVWVHSGNTIGMVPIHPADVRGQTPLNLSQGVFPVSGKGVSTLVSPAAGEKWSLETKPPRNLFEGGTLAAAPRPARVSRTLLSANSGARPITFSKNSSIAYDPVQHRFVNSNAPAPIETSAANTETSKTAPTKPSTSGTSAVSAAEVTPTRTHTPRPPSPSAAHGGRSGGSEQGAAIGGQSAATGTAHSSGSHAGGGHPH